MIKATAPATLSLHSKKPLNELPQKIWQPILFARTRRTSLTTSMSTTIESGSIRLWAIEALSSSSHPVSLKRVSEKQGQDQITREPKSRSGSGSMGHSRSTGDIRSAWIPRQVEPCVDEGTSHRMYSHMLQSLYILNPGQSSLARSLRPPGSQQWPTRPRKSGLQPASNRACPTIHQYLF